MTTDPSPAPPAPKPDRTWLAWVAMGIMLVNASTVLTVIATAFLTPIWFVIFIIITSWAPGQMFLASLAAAVITVAIISFCLVSEPEVTVRESRMPFRKFLLRGPFLLKNVRSYRMLLVVRIMLGVWGMALPFYILYARERLGLETSAVGIFLSVQMAGMVLSNLLWGALSNRAGNKMVLQLVSAVAILSPLVTTLTAVYPQLQNIVCFGVVFFFIGRINWQRLIIQMFPKHLSVFRPMIYIKASMTSGTKESN